ncbi:hypothetical protein [Thalassotalea mangrovi]|uniref:DUF3592 domain-containing protein n=1 Tax=Thalassotalea mangrovi TaxID=2572245 RepID=A0A4U1B2L0_9GAMM|nr:hypothetical protein [Thalassotalea mangrovi]TKB43719.1 hypothetical protein E8M12_13920 [Thalassotalea mangrovi]
MKVNDFVDHIKSYLAYLAFGGVFLFLTAPDLYNLYYKGAIYTGTVIEIKKVAPVRKTVMQKGWSEVSVIEVGGKYPININGKLKVGKEYTFRLHGSYPNRTQSIYALSHAFRLIEFHFLISIVLLLKGAIGIYRVRKKFNRVTT